MSRGLPTVGEDTPEGLGVQRALDEESGDAALAWLWHLPSVGFWWNHTSSSVYETEVETKMIPNTGWAQRNPEGWFGLWGSGESIKIQPFPTKLRHLWWWLRVRNKAYSLVWNMCSFVWKKRQKIVNRCSIYIFSNNNWTLRMIRACYEMCQNHNKISNLYHLPTYLISFLELASLGSSTRLKKKTKPRESWKGAHLWKDQTSWFALKCLVFFILQFPSTPTGATKCHHWECGVRN